MIVAFIILWEALVRTLQIPDYLVPGVWQVARVFFEDAATLFSQTAYTFVEWIVGVCLSILIGVAVALACFRWRRVRDTFGPILIVSQSVPYLAFAPLLLIWLGLGMTPKIVLVVLSCAFPVALALDEGLQKSRAEFHVVVSMMKLKWSRALRHVYFPAAMPQLFTGLKISASYAFVSTVMAELIGSESGLGIYLTRAQASYRTDRVVAAVVVIVVISIMTTYVVDQVKLRVVFWDSVRK